MEENKTTVAEESPAVEAAEARIEAAEAETSSKGVLNASVDPDKFDWDAFENDGDIYGAEDRKTVAEEYDRTLSKVMENEVVEGVVTAISKREVIVNIGYKSEGVIMAPEFRYNPELKVGDKVEVYVESAEDRKGQLILSHKKARALRSWDMVNEAYNNNEIVKGYVKTRTKGGMIVDIFGIEAFLPGSQIDIKPIRDYDQFVDTTMDFRIVKINQEFRNVVVSHKALIEAELEQQKSEIISKLEKGQVLEGTVKNITNYGVFVDLGGVDGLIHITDLSWGRINHPEEVVQLDQKIRVVILDFDESKRRIALGLKQLTVHPWDALDPNLKVGDKVKGKVVLIADYGAFVEIEPGVEGLIHVSEMSWSPRLRIAQDFLKVGDEVEAQILTLDREEKKMSLGLKQLVPNPWENIREKYPDVIIQSCASGGGRMDYGALRYCNEAWTSDNTEALTRVFIQYGTNLIYPAVVCGSHVSAVPNHQTGNITPLKFRFDVACSGRLGMELQPSDMTDEEKDFARKAIGSYKQYRDLVYYGDLYRMGNPYKDDCYALMYVSEDKSRAVFFAYTIKYMGRTQRPLFRLTGLDPEKKYRISELNVGKSCFWGNGRSFTGSYLASHGLNLNMEKVYSSAVFYIEAEQ